MTEAALTSPSIDWRTADVEPRQGSTPAQLTVTVRGVEPGWADAFNARAAQERNSVWGGQWGDVRYHETENIIVVNAVGDGSEQPLIAYLDALMVRVHEGREHAYQGRQRFLRLRAQENERAHERATEMRDRFRKGPPDA